ncbi:hypothetical protein PGT21_016446 [Puccinia graminis f. sp. tritici]|uniref:Uncharacterized protein n=1 Tax=Puccinia graminis f. sp. tritici TaxID=56615 RepID=A0A5B0QG45_PUCGR|nr:hypothetical protein PGT21_016446 [Puccinia graminis f. sp. tritici]
MASLLVRLRSGSPILKKDTGWCEWLSGLHTSSEKIEGKEQASWLPRAQTLK